MLRTEKVAQIEQGDTRQLYTDNGVITQVNTWQQLVIAESNVRPNFAGPRYSKPESVDT